MKYLLLALIFCSGCTPAYNKNGWSIWGWSKEKNDEFVHVGFISTDFFFTNSGNTTQTTKEKILIEKQLANELGFGTIGAYVGKNF